MLRAFPRRTWFGRYLGSSCLSMRRAPVGSETETPGYLTLIWLVRAALQFTKSSSLSMPVCAARHWELSCLYFFQPFQSCFLSSFPLCSRLVYTRTPSLFNIRHPFKLGPSTLLYVWGFVPSLILLLVSAAPFRQS